VSGAHVPWFCSLRQCASLVRNKNLQRFAIFLFLWLARGASGDELQQRVAAADRLLEAGATDEAIAQYRAALTLVPDAKPVRAQILDQLSAIETDTGDYAAAARDANEAAAIHEKTGDLRAQASSLNQAGLAQMYAGLYPAARASLQRALQVAAVAKDFEAIVEERMNLASVDFYTGRYTDAAMHYEIAGRVIDAHRGAEWTQRRRRILLANQATLDQRLGRYEEALAAYKQALSDTSDVRAEEHAQMLANLGVVYRRLGDPYKALEAYDQARAIFAEDQQLDGELGVLKNRGIVLALDLARLDEARETFADAYRRASAAGNAREALQAQLYGGETLLRLGRPDAALREFRSALEAANALETVEDQWKALYGSARCHLARADAANATRDLRAAVAVIENIRDSIRIPSLKSDFFNDKREVFDVLIALRLRHGADAREIFDLVERGHSRGWRERVGLRANVDLLAIQRALPDDAMLLDYWTSRAGSAVIAVTRTSAEVRRIDADSDAIHALVASLARGASPEWRAIAAKLRAQLLPVEITRPHLLVVTDGALASVPFELLPLRGELLVQRHDVTYLPTAAMLLREPRRVRRFAPPWTLQFRGFADPLFGSAALEDPAAIRDRLVASAREVEAIAKELGGRSLLHTGDDDQKQHLQSASQTPLVHIASHAFVDPGAIEQSRILFSAERRGGAASYLFLKEAYELPFDGVELAVLSACDTERGRVVAGEGIESFSRAFLAAGARTTVTTLWRVPDATTASFMRVFYHHLQRGASRAEALRLAKLRFIESGRDPHYWAAFVLTGDGLHPVSTAVRWATIIWVLAGVLSVTLLAIAWRHFTHGRHHIIR
jgi:tetratricopeptide (TPR) repeat protein